MADYKSKFTGAEIDDVIELFSQNIFPKKWVDKALNGELTASDIKEICTTLDGTDYRSMICFAKGKLWNVSASAGNSFMMVGTPLIWGSEMYIERYSFTNINGEVEQYRTALLYGMNIVSGNLLDWEHNSSTEE